MRLWSFPREWLNYALANWLRPLKTLLMSTEHNENPTDALFLEPDDPKTAASDAKVAELTAAVEAARAEALDFKDRYLRKAADFENAKKRFQKERDDLRQYAAEGVFKEMVAVLDDLHRAVKHFPSEAELGADLTNLVQGVRLVHRKFTQSLEKLGVTPVDSEGTHFDPTLHEALQQIEDPSVPEGTVVREFQRAYKLHDRLLRPAFVVVSRGGRAATDPVPVVEAEATEAPAVAPEPAAQASVEPSAASTAVETAESSG